MLKLELRPQVVLKTKLEKNRLSAPRTDRLQHWLYHLKIGKKISLGYVAVLGVAVLGTGIGAAIGEYYHRDVKQRWEEVDREFRLVQDLKSNLSSSQLHERALVAMVQQLNRKSIQPDRLRAEFREEYIELQEFAQAANRAWLRLKVFYGDMSSKESPQELAIFQALLNSYDGVTQEYVELIDQQTATVETATGQSIDSAALKSVLNQLDEHSLSSSFHEFMENSELLFENVLQKNQDVKVAVEKMELLRTQIIVISLLLSIAIAAVLAVLTKRMIVRPITTTTQVAQQVTQEDNFDLQAPVLSQDEIGVLTVALNELIQRVKYLLIQQKVTETQLIQSEKMSGLGQLVAGVAHEINNPVNFIQGNIVYAEQYVQDLLKLLHLYQQEYPNPNQKIQAEIDEIDLEFLQKDVAKLIHSMKIGSDRICEIVKSLRSFSRLDEAEVKAVDLHEGIDSTLVILHNRLKYESEHWDVEVIKDYGELPAVECYPGQLNQVFMNLLTNAIDALDEHNHQRSPADIKNNPSIIRICTELLPNDWIKIQIIDNGPGIPERISSKLFDPFFTTKPVGKGTGLGLSISYQIVVEKHGGKLSCHSTPGKGTEFVIEIPRVCPLKSA